MKKLIPLVILLSAMTACKAKELSSINLNDPTNEPLLEPTPTPVATATPIAPEVALQISNNASNGAIAMAGGVFGSLAMAKLSSVFDGSIFKGKNVYTPNIVTEKDVAEFQKNAQEILVQLFQSETSLEEGWVQATPSVEFCTKIATHDDNIKACSQLIAHLSFQVQLTDQHSGIVLGFFDSEKFITLDFSPSDMNVEVTLANLPVVFKELKNTWESQGVKIDLPDLSSAQGTLRANINRIDKQIHLGASVAKTVTIEGDHAGNPVSVILPQKTAVDVDYDQDLSLATVTLNIGKVNISDGFHLTVGKAITGKIYFDDQSVEVRAEHLTVSGAGFELTDVEEPVRFGIEPFNATLKFLDDGIVFTNDSTFSFFTVIPEGTTSWGMNAGGTLTIRGENQPWLVQNTVIDMYNSGVFGDGLLSIPSDSCFTLKPWEVVKCEVK